jgi:hypothetical protein
VTSEGLGLMGPIPSEVPMSTTAPSGSATEPFITISDAAKKLGLFPWQIRRAVKAGIIPSYRAFNGRPRVRLSEVVAAIEATRTGGAGK